MELNTNIHEKYPYLFNIITKINSIYLYAVICGQRAHTQIHLDTHTDTHVATILKQFKDH